MKRFITCLAVLGFLATAYAEENFGEKAGSKVNNATRTMKKGAHRVQEKLCAKGDLECAKQKAANRAEEAGDYIQDKTEQVKDKVD